MENQGNFLIVKVTFQNLDVYKDKFYITLKMVPKNSLTLHIILMTPLSVILMTSLYPSFKAIGCQ